MRRKRIYHTATGGTVGSGITEAGVRDINSQAQSYTRGLLERIPFTEYRSIPVKMRGDSSAHPRAHLLDLGNVVLEHANQGDGMVIEHGTDTLNLTAATLALMGNEVLKVPVVLLASMKGPDKKDSDAPENTITAGFFAAYGDASGVFAVRPGGIVVTSRHDTPGGSVDWHSRGTVELQRALTKLREEYLHRGRSPQEELLHEIFGKRVNEEHDPLYKGTRAGYFARVNLEKLVGRDFEIIFDITKKKRRPFGQELQDLIEYHREFEDGTLDTADEVPIGGRGRVPNLRLLGLGRTRIVKFKSRPVEDSPQRVQEDIKNIIGEQRLKRKVMGSIIPYLSLIEHVRRHRDKVRYNTDSHLLHEKWKEVMSNLLKIDFGADWHTAKRIVSFWEKYSDVPNGAMDFSGIACVRVSSDPNLLYQAFQATPPRGLILQATGAAGMRLREDFGESYEPLLTYCRKLNIPVVLTSSSRGEVTSFEYGPGREALEKDLCFFAGTLDADLVEPRMALLNAGENRQFINKLITTLEVPESQRADITRNIYRTLLSGSHYRRAESGETSDRARVEQLYGIETRVDLLSGTHVKKAILAAYLHEVHFRKMPLPTAIVDALC